MALTACAEPASPTAPDLADAAAVSAGVAVLDSALAAPALQGVVAMGGLMSTRSSVVSLRLFAAPRCAAPVEAAMAAPILAASASGPIADSLLRHVLVYDTALARYRVSADTSGPANGVRFLLYTLNQYGRPTLPLSSVGWLDLINGATAQGVTEHVAGQAGSVADLAAALAGTATVDTALLVGAIYSGARVLLVHDSALRLGPATTAITATLSDSTDDIAVRLFAGRTSYDAFDFTDTMDLSYRHGTQTVRVAGTIDTYCLIPSVGLAVSVNGTAFAAVTNSSTLVPNVTRVDKQPITAAQIQAILDLKDCEQRLFAAFVALAEPPALLLPP